MWRSKSTSLAGLDDRCAAHHFIRVYGRRPTPEELERCRQVGAGSARWLTTHAGPGAAVALMGRMRRELARLIAEF